MIGTYAPALVGLSFLVAIVASYVAFALAAHITATRGWAGTYWLVGGAVALGTGIWSMHFIGMLAFKLPIPMSYSAWATLGSLFIAILVSAFVLRLVSRARLTLATLSIGAVAMGVGISLMHYVGMAAMQVTPAITYSPTLVSISIAVAIAASALALSLAFSMRSLVPARAIGRRLLGAVVMGVGICAMHYTGMAATNFAPGTICTSPGLQLDQTWLAFTVATATLLFLGATMLILTIDVRLAQQLDEANARVAALAREDPLTGLANRRTFLEHLDAAFSGRTRGAPNFAVLFLDLDGFKDINDTLGHAAGDALINEVAQRLKMSVRRDDLVARFGGDEFAILQRSIAGPSDAGALAEKLGAAIARACAIGHDEVRVTASIGIAQASEKTTSPSDLMVQADLALYRAKDEGRNRYCFHDGRLDRQVHLRSMLARELHTAIARGELELHYRPQVHIPTGRIAGLETHVLWNHPSRGMIHSDVLLPVAERAGMIRAVGEWAIGEACAQLRRWLDHDVAPPVLAVDITLGQLRAADLVSSLKACLDTHGIATERLELEFDEHVFMQALERYPATLDGLRESGFRVAITNFGLGYSPIGYLAKWPVDRLRMPQAMVAEALSSAPSAKAIRAIVNLAHAVDVEVIADGVETQLQAAFLLAADCEQAQGPLFGPLLSALDATMLLRGGNIQVRSSSVA